MNYLFHNYFSLLSELPHLRQAQGKTPVDAPWKTPLSGHEIQALVQHWVHLEHQLMKKEEVTQ